MQLPTEITEELAEETGWHIGDGSMNYYKNNGKLKGLYSLRGHIIDDKPHYIERIKPIFKQLYDLDVPIHEMPITSVFGFQVWNDALIKFKESLGLPLGEKKNITIPKHFLISDKLKAAVIRGIFDTDGCVYLEHKHSKLYPSMQFSTTSLPLAKQVHEIYLSLGLRATRHSYEHKDHPNWSTINQVWIRGVEMLHKFMQIINPQNPKHIKKYLSFCENSIRTTKA